MNSVACDDTEEDRPMPESDELTSASAAEHTVSVPADLLADSLYQCDKNYADSLLYHLIQSAGISLPLGQFPQRLAMNATELPGKKKKRSINREKS